METNSNSRKNQVDPSSSEITNRSLNSESFENNHFSNNKIENEDLNSPHKFLLSISKKKRKT